MTTVSGKALARAGMTGMAILTGTAWMLPAAAYADVIWEPDIPGWPPMPGEPAEPVSEATDVSGTLTLITILVVLVALAAWMTYVIVISRGADDGGGTDDATNDPSWHDEAQDRMEDIL